MDIEKALEAAALRTFILCQSVAVQAAKDRLAVLEGKAPAATLPEPRTYHKGRTPDGTTLSDLVREAIRSFGARGATIPEIQAYPKFATLKGTRKERNHRISHLVSNMKLAGRLSRTGTHHKGVYRIVKPTPAPHA